MSAQELGSEECAKREVETSWADYLGGCVRWGNTFVSVELHPGNGLGGTSGHSGSTDTTDACVRGAGPRVRCAGCGTLGASGSRGPWHKPVGQPSTSDLRQ